jgi:mRNA capping enzyme, beta chain/mRNA capping enzyme, catalytic domain
LGNPDASKLKHDLHEHEYVETVYTGYSNGQRVCYDGLHPPKPGSQPKYGKAEYKDKLDNRDFIIPAANYDMRISCSAEKILDARVPNDPPSGWTQKRIKRRRSYTRRDGTIKWQVDVTEVTTSKADPNKPSEVSYEIEFELVEQEMLKLVNEQDDTKLKQKATMLAQQLWWILQQINPLKDVVDADECLQDHPNKKAVEYALAQCGYMKKWMDEGANVSKYSSPIGKSDKPSPGLSNVKFPGCMPVNFSRHNIEEVQRSPENGYFLSEKTDGVRHFMIFTGDTVVLVDRAMKGKQPAPVEGGDEEPMKPLLKLINPGTVFDGGRAMHCILPWDLALFCRFSPKSFSSDPNKRGRNAPRKTREE